MNSRATAGLLLSLVLGLGIPSSAFAFEVATDNPDMAVRWDNTLRYNLGVRTQKQDSHLLNTSIMTIPIPSSSVATSWPTGLTCSVSLI